MRLTANQMAAQRLSQQKVIGTTFATGETMTYAEKRFDIGSIQVEASQNPYRFVIPHPFGSVTSFVATVATEGRVSGSDYLWFRFSHSLGGTGYWSGVPDVEMLDGSTYRLLRGGKASITTRFFGPFADTMSLELSPRDSDRDQYSPKTGGAWSGLVLTIGFQSM